MRYVKFRRAYLYDANPVGVVRLLLFDRELKLCVLPDIRRCGADSLAIRGPG